LSDGWGKNYIEMFGSFTEPFSCIFESVGTVYAYPLSKQLVL